MITWSECQYVLRTMLRWWWVIFLATVTAGSTAFLLSRQERFLYVSRATLQIGNTFESTRPDESSVMIGSTMAEYYAELARREVILRPIQEQLRLPSWELMRDQMVATGVIPAMNLVEITVTDTNPERAALIANAVGERLVQDSPGSPEKIQATQQAIQQQLDASTMRINQLKSTIDQLTAQSLQATSASDLTDINAQLQQLNVSLAREEETYRSLVVMQQSTTINSLHFFERAVPSAPQPTRRTTTVVVAGLAGLLVSLLAVYSLDRLDDRWRGRADIEEYFKMRSLGMFPLAGPIANQELVAQRARAIEQLYTNILLSAPERKVHTLLVSSPNAAHNRSDLSLELAQQFARFGYKTLIVDAEGSNELLIRSRRETPTGGAGEWICLPAADNNDVWVHLRPTTMTNIMLLPGPLTDSSGLPALVPALRWPELSEHLRRAADVVIFDGPSALCSADAALLAPHVDGVILAINPDTDTRTVVGQSKERLLHWQNAHDARLFGAVILASPRSLRLSWKRLQAASVEQRPALGAPEPVGQTPALAERGPTLITSVEEIVQRLPASGAAARIRRGTPPQIKREVAPEIVEEQAQADPSDLLRALLGN